MKDTGMPSLFDPIEFGAISARNRIVMAPLTRARATQEHVPTPIMAQYYAQRATAGLIISEATAVSRQGMGWPFAPGIWNDGQAEAWKPVTAAVHEAGGRILAQLWHMGRLVHPEFRGGELPVSSSSVAAPGHAHTYQGNRPHVAPRPLEVSELPAIIDDYAAAARRAMAAGFDGVQIHAANGYLIDQFLRDNCNQRTDDYGGSVENRIRLLGEITRAVADTVGANRTAVRISPNGNFMGIDDSNPAPLFTAAAADLANVGLALLEVRDGKPGSGLMATDVPSVAPAIRKAFPGPLVLNYGYDRDSAQAELDSGAADAISFGLPFIANPDLPFRMAEGKPLAHLRSVESLYSQVAEGYIDYPSFSCNNLKTIAN
jgi:N-ethylmaleimide reductase